MSVTMRRAGNRTASSGTNTKNIVSYDDTERRTEKHTVIVDKCDLVVAHQPRMCQSLPVSKVHKQRFAYILAIG